MKRRSFIAVALGLVFVAGLLGVGKASASAPESSARPPKPFYGTVTLYIRTLGLDPAVRICGNVIYSGQASGWSRICNQASRWVWVRRGAFVSVGLQVLSPPQCKSPAPFNLPRVSQRVNITFTLDCRKAKTTTTGPKPCAPGFKRNANGVCVPKQPALVPVTIDIRANGCFAGSLEVRRGGATVRVVNAPSVCLGVGVIQVRLGNQVCLVVTPPFRVTNGPVCITVVAAGQYILFIVDGQLPPTSPPGIQPICPPGTQLTLAVTINGFTTNYQVVCGGFLPLPPGATAIVCLAAPTGSVFPAPLPAGVGFFQGKAECIIFVVTGTVVVNVSVPITIGLPPTQPQPPQQPQPPGCTGVCGPWGPPPS